MAASEKDIPIVEPGGKDTSPPGLAQSLVGVYQSLLLTQKYDRQHRSSLIALSTIDVDEPLAELNITAGGAYNQAQVQAIADKVDELVAAHNNILSVLAFIKDVMSTNISTEI